jgi:hypothetical protein
MELAEDRVQWRALVIAVLNPRGLLPYRYLVRDIACTLSEEVSV